MLSPVGATLPWMLPPPLPRMLKAAKLLDFVLFVQIFISFSRNIHPLTFVLQNSPIWENTFGCGTNCGPFVRNQTSSNTSFDQDIFLPRFVISFGYVRVVVEDPSLQLPLPWDIADHLTVCAAIALTKRTCGFLLVCVHSGDRRHYTSLLT